MASVQELKAVLKSTLEKRGVLGQIKARVRAEVFSALDDETDPRPPLSNENMLINELIREYLEFNKYKYTTSILMAESGQPQTPLDRQFLVNELNITEDSTTAQIPLLYGILSHFLEHNLPSSSSLPSGKERALQSHRVSATRQIHGRHRSPTRDIDFDDPTNKRLSEEPVVVRGGRR
ncbi:centrosomal protein 20-like [Amphiura filiformis]|uniref:centrosomal protein 20-like n=1 Tax=Amphiura filiformis TaxID=82378 RepID=UPI003B20EC48